MQKYYIEDCFDIADAMHNEIENNKKEEVIFVGFYEDAIEVIKELLMFEDVMPHSIKIHAEDWDGYDKEYYVTLDENLEVYVEPAFTKIHNRYLYGRADVLFIMGDCNSSIIHAIECDKVFEVTFDDEEDECTHECNKDCRCKCESSDKINTTNENSVLTRVIKDKDGRVRGFEKTWENIENGIHYYSHYEHFSDNIDLLNQLMDNFNIKMK